MNKHPMLHFLPVVPEEQKRAILLKVENEEFYLTLYNIVLIEVDNHSLTYYTLDASEPGGVKLYQVKATLSQTKLLLGPCFVQPNQSMLFNRPYLNRVVDKRYVYLHFPQKLPKIVVTKEFKATFFPSLNCLDYKTPLTPPNPPLTS